MGFRVTVTPEPGSELWSLTLGVDLSRTESNALFLCGDSILAWPTEGLAPGPQQNGVPGLERTGMFVSEVAARASGLRILYCQRAQAERAAAQLRAQLASVEIREETE
ncbi:MAG: hypothetical protein A2W26_13095 [Acidobacteria bacterium RBG_16_64_8]|nr:MAG: hypothetical protein A2W26_13095 [Acidobacteria bacterium RBG_16_64_8]